MSISGVQNNRVTVYAVTNFNPTVLNGSKAATLARKAVSIFGEEANARDLGSLAELVVEPTLRTQNSWKLVRSIGNYCFGSGNQLDPKHLAVGSVLYPEDVAQAAEIGFKTVVSPMTDRDVLQAAKEHKIDAVPAIGRMNDGIGLDKVSTLIGFDPKRIKVFPFSCAETSQANIAALSGPFSRVIEAKRIKLVPAPNGVGDVGSATELWGKLKTANEDETIIVGKPPRSKGLESLEFLMFCPRLNDERAVPVVTGGIKADRQEVTKLVANGVRHFGLSALINDLVQKDASGQNPNLGDLRANIGVVLDGIQSGLEVKS